MEPHIYQEFKTLESSHWWFCGRRAYLRAIVQRFMGPQGRDLQFCEVGSGTGGNLGMLGEFATTDALEMNAQARDIIRERNIPNVRSVADGRLPDHVELPPVYDGVFALDVVEHVDDDRAAVRRLAELANEGGKVVLTVPAYQWLWSAHDVANHHKRRYTQKQFVEIVEAAGLKVLYTSYFNSLLLPLAIVSRLAERFVGAKQAGEKATLGMPPRLLNSVFKWLFSLEKLWAGKLRMPFGLSIVVVAGT